MQQHGQAIALEHSQAAILSNATALLYLSIKYLFNQALRQTIVLIESMIKLTKLGWQAPNYSALIR